ncbi:MAG: pentapeptide repeat protein [Gammaproteobacteria bacterium]|jgi:uncharacterized protein YjbI with pentapeptide repeats|nr:pentapeptide repeat protein [Gammaproteobacteria bacterium]
MKKIFYCVLLFISGISLAANLQQNVQKLVTTCSCERCDLTHAKLSGLSLGQHPAEHGQRDYLNECNLNQANLSHANLDYAKLIGAGRSYALNINLNQAKLMGARLKNTEFYRIDCNETNFSRANLTGSSLKNSNFIKANFNRANLRYVTTLYKRINLGSQMSQANFSYANLLHAQLDATLDGANFNHANLHNAILDPAIIDVQGSNNSGFAELNFSYANLTDAELYETQGAAIPFYKTNFTGADLKGARFFTGYRLGQPQSTDINAAIFCHTTMPDGKINNRDCLKKSNEKTN